MMKLSAIRYQRSAGARRLPGASPCRPGFSLVELMIAIMILGLGMVMAATIFPVSLDMTRGTVQLNISESAADAAVATLAVRVPRYKNLVGAANDDFLNGIPIKASPRVAVPNTVLIDHGICDLSNEDLRVLGLLPPPYDTIWSHLMWIPPAPAPYSTLASLLTEMSFWDSQYAPTTSAVSTFIVRGQNMDVLNRNAVADIVPSTVSLPAQVPPFGRLSLADRVYPPVDIYDMNGLLRTPVDLLAEIAQRRYSWTAIQFRDIHDESQKTFFARIVVFYRGSLSARYVMQSHTAGTAATNLPIPQDTEATDTLFPQPWLVSLDNVVNTGVVTCTARVARMLPVGSYFVMAQGTNSGRYTKVLSNSWNGVAVDDQLVQLQVKPGEFPTGTNSVVWVFPPALRSAPPAGRSDPAAQAVIQFENTTPVVDVVPKKVIAG